MASSSDRAAALIRDIRVAGSIDIKGDRLRVSPRTVAQKYASEIAELKPVILHVLGDLCPVCGDIPVKQDYGSFIYTFCPGPACRGYQRLSVAGGVQTLKGVFTTRLREWCHRD